MQLLCPEHLQWLHVTLPHHWQADNLGPGRLLTTLSEFRIEPGFSSIVKLGLYTMRNYHACLVVCYLDNQRITITTE